MTSRRCTCGSGVWLWRFRVRMWLNGWPRRIEAVRLPPLNPSDPPHNQWRFLLLFLGVTLRVDYSPTGPFHLWCAKYDYPVRPGIT